MVYVKSGKPAGAETESSNNRRAAVGQRGDPGIRGTGTTSAVSPACRVFVRVTGQCMMRGELVKGLLDEVGSSEEGEESDEQGTPHS